MPTAIINSPLGKIAISSVQGKVTSLEFLDSDNAEISMTIPKELENVVVQLEEYFRGKRKNFNLLLSPSGTEFQMRVWSELQKISYGSTVSYERLADNLASPKLIRAAASANGKNPIPIIIPCHRVIGKNGSLTGYSGGLSRKKWLLELENPTFQQTLF